MPSVSSTRPPAPRRPWIWDALSALAFGGQALVLGKMASRMLGPIAGLFVFLICGGLCWMFGRSAWRGVTADRENNLPRE